MDNSGQQNPALPHWATAPFQCMADPPKRQLRKQSTVRLKPPLDTGLGKVYLERRNGSPHLYARTYIQGGYQTHCTGKTDERDAREEAGKWFFRIYKESQTSNLRGRRFSDVAEEFLRWLEDTKSGELSEGQIRNYKQKWSLFKEHPKQFFERKKVEDVDHQFLVKLRDERRKDTNKRGDPITNATIRKDLLFVRSEGSLCAS